MTKHICEKCDDTMQLVCPTCESLRTPDPRVEAVVSAARKFAEAPLEFCNEDALNALQGSVQTALCRMDAAKGGG